MNIDFSEINKVLDAVANYEIYRQMVIRLSEEIGSEGCECLVLKQGWEKSKPSSGYSNAPPSCIESYWSTNTFLAAEGEEDNLKEQGITYMTYDNMCNGCKRKQAVIDERKRCKKMLGRAKTAISREGKLILADFHSEEQCGKLFNDFYNPLGLK